MRAAIITLSDAGSAGRREDKSGPVIRELLEAGELRYVTFTSASTVKGFVSSVGEGADFSKITGLCIGEQTAAQARKYGMAVRVAEQATVDGLVDLAIQCAKEEASWI